MGFQDGGQIPPLRCAPVGMTLHSFFNFLNAESFFAHILGVELHYNNGS